jgi:hypothetical protein
MRMLVCAWTLLDSLPNLFDCGGVGGEAARTVCEDFAENLLYVKVCTLQGRLRLVTSPWTVYLYVKGKFTYV